MATTTMKPAFVGAAVTPPRQALAFIGWLALTFCAAATGICRRCALLAALLIWVVNCCFSAPPDTDGTSANHSVRIRNQDVPLTFGNQSVPEDVKRSIAADLSLSVSSSTSIVLRASEVSRRVDEWHGRPVTHGLCEMRRGKCYRLNQTTFPSLLREHFGYAVTISNTQHLIVNEELLAAYVDTLDAVKRHPTMLSGLTKHLALLQDADQLELIAGDQEQAREFVYCYRVSLDTGLSLLRTYVRDLSAAHDLTIKPPSLLDIVSLKRGVEDRDAPDDVYIVSAVITGQETPDSERFTDRLPIGAFSNGKWRLFAWPIP